MWRGKRADSKIAVAHAERFFLSLGAIGVSEELLPLPGGHCFREEAVQHSSPDLGFTQEAGFEFRSRLRRAVAAQMGRTNAAVDQRGRYH